MIVRSVVLAAALCAGALFLTASVKDDSVAARRTALDLAGAFSNDGFKLRDGHWTGSIAPKEKALVAVNLYAGNEYWFSVGGAETTKKLSVNVYDEEGKPVEIEPYEDGEKAAAGLSASHSGQYFVSIGLEEGEPGSVCLVYSYK